MEPVSITASLLNLVGLFNNAVDWFGYIQLARDFGRSYETSLVKLDLARLQLSRWGQAVGISGDVTKAHSLPKIKFLEQDIERAEHVLGMILKLLADAKATSDDYVSGAAPVGPRLSPAEPSTELSLEVLSLHNNMGRLCSTRQGRTGLYRKVRWALYEERILRKLLDDITHLVNQLVAMFPAAQDSQQSLCDAEVKELGADEKALRLLREAAAQQDDKFEAAVEKAISRCVSLRFARSQSP